MLIKSIICLIVLFLTIQLNETTKQNEIFDPNYGMMEAVPDSRMVCIYSKTIWQCKGMAKIRHKA